MKKLFTTLILAVLAPYASSRTIYVDANGTGDYPTIQAATYDANDGDEIILLPGTYTGTNNCNIEYFGKAVTVRSIEPNNSQIVADTVIDCESTTRGFWFHNSEGPESVLQGITIIDGRGQEYDQRILPYHGGLYGAAILCDNASPTIDRCVIKNNIYNSVTFYQCSPILKNCVITENSDYEAAVLLSESDAIIENCLIAHNITYESAIYCYISSPQINDCNIIYNHYDGISILGEDTFPEVTAPVITRCNISNNQRAGIISYPEATSTTNTTLIDCRISGNTWGIGLDYDDSLYLKNCIIEDTHYEHDYGNGVAIFTYGDLVLENCIIRNNIAEDAGAVLSGSGSLNMRNCLITSNRNGVWGYREGEPLIAIGGSSLRRITNCIIWGNNGIIFEETSDPNLVVTYCDVQGGWPGEGNINVEPLLTPDGHLTAGSPCIDTGSDANAQEYDIDGEPRPAGPAADIGIDEFIDTDTDQMPDFWEQNYFGSTTSAEPNANPDSDFYSNITEYELYSSSPTDPAKIYYVDANMPDDSGNGLTWPTAKQTITAAIDLAQNSDTIIIAPGLYEEDSSPDYKNSNLDPNGKAITIRSIDPDDPNIVESTVIDADNYRCFWLDSGEPRACVIEGLTLDSGNAEELDDRVTFYEYWGRAVLCEMASPTIRNCRITGRSSRNICVGGPGSRPLIEKCDIISGSYNIRCHWSAATINDCNIHGNPSSVGISLTSDSSTVSNCIISNYQYGIECDIDDFSEYGYSPNPSIVNCIITENNWAGIRSEYSNLKVRNCTLLGNLINLRFENTSFEEEVLLTLENSILAKPNHTYSLNIWLIDANAVISHCDIVGGQDSIYPYGDNVSWGPGNIDVDPCFVIPGYWDANGTPADVNDDFWVVGDYYLKSAGWRWDTERQRWDWDDVTSRCIDAGNPGSPLADEPNIVDEWTAQNLRINMGAYGGTAEASMPPYGWALLCDIDNSGIVDLKDFAWLSSLWMQQDDSLFADFNRDLNVDSNDLDLLIEDWLSTTTWN